MKAIFFSLLLANLALAAYLLFGSAVPEAAPPARSVAANLELLSERPGRTAREAAAEEIFENPIVEAIQNEVSRIPLPSNLEKNGDYFGLKVQGDSMIEAGIHEGDTVIIKRTDTADNGKIVVALIDEHEAMLKRIRKKGKVVALESANKNYETKIFGPDRVKVQGVLVSLYRNF